MRKGYNNSILRDDSNNVIGIDLGADFVSEHEWGIGEINRQFGILGEGDGLDKRTITKVPTNLHFNKEVGYLILSNQIKIGETLSRAGLSDFNLVRLVKSSREDSEIRTAWDSGSLGISVVTPDDQSALEEIYQAIIRLDACLFLGGGGLFKNAGLVIVIKSRVPSDKAQLLKDLDIDQRSLEQAALKTGIELKLKNAKCGYYALAPRWKDSETKTSYPVIFWLNPTDQNNNHYGWYTVEELELWAQGKGPVIDNAIEYRKQRERDAKKKSA